MIQIMEKDRCCGCFACATSCPKNCIEMLADKEGFLYPKVKKSQCIDCGLCEKVCPIIKKESSIEYCQKVFAAKNKDDDILKNSSSGGIFTELATEVIKRGGVVFGAGFNSNFVLEHSYVEKIDDLCKFRGSKYVQSVIGNTYKQAEKFLKEGRLVYFSGTPCQISGLKKYLKKSYKNLITQDFICHGVPSPKLWGMYVKNKRKNRRVEKVNFKDKRKSWHEYSMSISYKNGSSYEKLAREDSYLKAFIKNLSLRPSCYNCSFKGIKRDSDITLADFWGVEKLHPELDDDKGTSLIFINSTSGADAFDKIKERLIFWETDKDLAIANNSAMVRSVSKHMNRDIYMRKIRAKNFDEITEKYIKYSIDETILQKIKLKIKTIIKGNK